LPISAVASTAAVFPTPVGPRNRRFLIGRRGEVSPEVKFWNASVRWATDSFWPTILCRSADSNSRTASLRRDGSRSFTRDATLESRENGYFLGSGALAAATHP